MRRLMWFAIGFVAACAVGGYLVSGSWLLLLALFCLGAVISLFFVKGEYVRIARLAAIGCLVGFLWFWVFDLTYLAPAREYDAQTVDTSVTIVDYSEKTEYGVSAEGKITLDGRTYRVKAYLYQDTQLKPGDTVNGEIRLRFTSHGGADEPTFHRGNGVFFLAYCDEDVQLTYGVKVPARYSAAWLRCEITELLDSIFPQDTLGFAKALLLGDTSGLTYETGTQLTVSGIRHVVAVSGLHVSILMSVLMLLFGKRRVLVSIIGVVVLAAFAALAGFTPSVVRACIMQGLMLLSLLFLKEYDSPTSLAFSVLVMLMVNPLAITSVSLQLSAGSIIGICLFTKRAHDYMLSPKRMGPAKGNTVKARLTRWFVSSVSVTLGAMSVTTPLSCCYFGAVSIVGILTNLLTLWAVTFVFQGIMLACVAGAIWLPLGKIVAWLVSWLARYVLFIAKLLSSVPFASVYTASAYIVIWLIFCYVLLAMLLCSKKKHPFLTGVSIVVSLALAIAVSWLEPRLDSFRVSVLDVGQGQCILLKNEDAYYLVDCGGDSAEVAADKAAELLLSQGVTKLDGLILTHYDNDHAAGAVNLLQRISADKLYLPDMQDAGTIKQQLTFNYADTIQWIPEDTVFTMSEADITLCSGQYSESDNESSVCVLFQPENCDILITGDRSIKGEKALLAQISLPELEVLVVGHHGAKTSTSIELLHETSPQIAVISVGERNDYGHPAAVVLERLEAFGCQIYRTDLSGTITFRG